MTEQTIDLSNADRPEDYSDRTKALALAGIRKGLVSAIRHQRGQFLTVRCESLTSPNVWMPVAHFGARGNISGVTCNCPNGQKGGIRARCWHAAALEEMIRRDQEENGEQDELD